MMDLMWPLCVGKRILPMEDAVGGEVAESRNRIVAQVLGMETKTTQIEGIFWVDDDVLIMRTALIKLYEHRLPIASGVYCTKCEPEQWLIFPEKLTGTLPFIPDKIFNVWGHGMGLTLVKTEVYKTMLANKLPRDKYGCPEWYKTNKQYKIEDGILDCGGTEDLHFLDNAGKLGYKTIVDTSRHTFGFHFDLESKKGFPQPQFKQWAARKAVTWETKDGLITWE